MSSIDITFSLTSTTVQSMGLSNLLVISDIFNYNNWFIDERIRHEANAVCGPITIAKNCPRE